MKIQESMIMGLFKRLGLEGIAWSLRRLYVPVSKDALVLDVGSGGNPYPRANVLLDAYEDTVERYHLPLVKDRPMVLGRVERLPFRDKAFDFVIASHVLEHLAEPGLFLKELMRVGKSGYIETPDAFFERVNPFRFHRLEVTNVNQKLRIYKKPSWRHASDLVDNYERKLKNKRFIRFISRNPEPFHMRFYWSDDINYEVINPEVNAAWPFPSDVKSGNYLQHSFRSNCRKEIINLIRYVFSQRERNKHIDLISLLQCPGCRNNELSLKDENINCTACNTLYLVENGIPHMFPVKEKKLQ